MRNYLYIILMIQCLILSEPINIQSIEFNDTINIKKIKNCYAFFGMNSSIQISKNIIKVDSTNKKIYYFVRANINPEEVNTINQMYGFEKYVGLIINSNNNQNNIDSLMKDISLINNINILHIRSKSAKFNNIREPKRIELNIKDSLNFIRIDNIDTIKFGTILRTNHLTVINYHNVKLKLSQSSNKIDTVSIRTLNFNNYSEFYKNKTSCKNFNIDCIELNKSNIIPKSFLQDTDINGIIIKNGVIENLNNCDSLSEYLDYLRFDRCYMNIMPKAWCRPDVFIQGAIIHDDGEYFYYKELEQVKFHKKYIIH